MKNLHGIILGASEIIFGFLFIKYRQKYNDWYIPRVSKFYNKVPSEGDKELGLILNIMIGILSILMGIFTFYHSFF